MSHTYRSDLQVMFSHCNFKVTELESLKRHKMVKLPRFLNTPLRTHTGHTANSFQSTLLQSSWLIPALDEKAAAHCGRHISKGERSVKYIRMKHGFTPCVKKLGYPSLLPINFKAKDFLTILIEFVRGS